jgi:hypothetical protein
MTRVRIFACAGAGLALVAIGWCLSTLHSAAVEGLDTSLSRSGGLALFGIAMVAAGLAFRAAMMVPKAPETVERRRDSEFRRGFAKTGKAPARSAAAQQPSQHEVVVALRRAVVAQATQPTATSPETTSPEATLPTGEVERLQELLHSRAAQLRNRNTQQARRRFLDSGVDVHGLAQS